jgi:hypothetical protein
LAIGPRPDWIAGLRKEPVMRRLLSAAVALAIALLAAHPPAALAQQTAPAALTSALRWMEGQQQPDGSFPGFGPGDTADAVMAVVAAGAPLDASATSPVEYLKGEAAAYAASGVGGAAKLVLAAVAAGEDPGAFGDVNLLAELGKAYDQQTGQYGADVYGHALALLAIRAAGATPPAAAVARLIDLQLEDGGWSFDGTAATGSDTNTTSVALQALAALRQGDAARAAALAYLKGQQNDDGGFPYSQSSQFGNATDANSTAAALQALAAAGEDPEAAAWAPGGNTPLDALVALQNSSGAFRYQAAQGDDNALATYAAVLGLAGAALPVRTANVAGAQAAVAPAAALPATGAAESAMAMPALLAAGLALGGAGLLLRRRGAAPL